MHLEQFYLACLAQASYIVIDERTKAAIVIDPRRDIEPYLEAAEKRGATIRAVLLTHFHADFVAGHLELREREGAKIYLGARAEAEFAFEPLAGGDVLEFGDVRFEVRETPGHTPEGVSFVLFDAAEDRDRPVAVFTGDTLFVGDVGRPDLLASVGVSEEELAGWMYDSLHDELLALPDETLVYPAHGAGSMCGRSLGEETFSTIGTQRRENAALQPMTREAFVELITAPRPAAPAYFAHDADLNRRERPTLDESLERSLRPLSADELVEAQRAGAVVLDVRDVEAFAAGHFPGSLNIGLGGKYATWAGTVIPADADVVLVSDAGDEREAAMRLGRIGFDRVRGYLDGGMAARAASGAASATVERVTPDELEARMASDDPPLLVDVRGPGEYEQSHALHAISIPLPELQGRLDELPSTRTVAVMCQTGYRSSLAASLLLRAGRGAVLDAIGGIEAWSEAGRGVVLPAASRGS